MPTLKDQMLNEEHRAQIRAEEIFREEVRRELQANRAAPSKKEKLWTAINSSFFLWCMSSLVLGILSFSYQEWSTSRTERLARAEMARKIDAEISSRLSFFRNQLLIGMGEQEALKGLELTGGVFSEFQSRSFRSLLWDLASLVPPTQRPEIQLALEESIQFSNVYLLADSDHNFFHSVDLELNFRGAVEHDIFSEIDKLSASQSSAPPPTGDHGSSREGPSQKVESGWDTLKDFYSINETDEKDHRATLDIYTPDLPAGKIHVISILPNRSNHTVRAFNLKRWGTPFSGRDAVAALQAKIFQQLASKK